MRAVIIGATGLTGSHLLEQMLDCEQVSCVVTLSRKRISNNHPKHINHEVDLLDPATYVDYLTGSHLFICTGTTQAKTPDKAQYYRIEHDLPVAAAAAALAKGFSAVIAVSALGASPTSRISYNKGKGLMERDIEQLGFKACHFVQPALIGGNRQESRPAERFFVKIQRVLDPLFIGFLRKYRIIEPDTIAKAMLYIAIHGYNKSRIESDELKVIASQNMAGC